MADYTEVCEVHKVTLENIHYWGRLIDNLKPKVRCTRCRHNAEQDLSTELLSVAPLTTPVVQPLTEASHNHGSSTVRPAVWDEIDFTGGDSDATNAVQPSAGPMSFRHFQRLPDNVQEYIWLLTVDPITIDVETNAKGDTNEDGIQFILRNERKWTDIRFYHVDSRSRQFAIKYFGTPSPHSIPIGKCDTLAFATWSKYTRMPVDTDIRAHCYHCTWDEHAIMHAPVAIRRPFDFVRATQNAYKEDCEEDIAPHDIVHLHVVDNDLINRIRNIEVTTGFDLSVDLLKAHKIFWTTVRAAFPRIERLTIHVPNDCDGIVAAAGYHDENFHDVYNWPLLSLLGSLSSLSHDEAPERRNSLWFKGLEGRDDRPPFPRLKEVVLMTTSSTKHPNTWYGWNDQDEETQDIAEATYEPSEWAIFAKGAPPVLAEARDLKGNKLFDEE